MAEGKSKPTKEFKVIKATKKTKQKKDQQMAETATKKTEKPQKFSAVMSTSEYEEKCKKNGTVFGREKDVKTECTIEELRVLINSNWTPEMVMDKHGMSEEEHKQLVWKLSKAERRETPIRFTKLAYNKG